MNILTQFGVDNLYTFTTEQSNYQCDFGQRKSYMSGLPGVHGGVSGLGTGPGKADVGTVKVDLWLHFDNPNDASDKIDSLRQMMDWGLQPLVMQPTVGGERFCWARLIDAPLEQDVRGVPHLRQQMTLTFEVPDPFWYTEGVERLWDDGSLWGSGNWDGSASAPAATSVTTNGTFTVTVGGKMFTLARLIVENNSAAVASNPKIRRIVNGATVDEVEWIGELAAGEFLEIDARAQTVIRVGTNVYDTFEMPLNPDWFRLYPGANSIECFITGTSDFSARWMERYT